MMARIVNLGGLALQGAADEAVMAGFYCECSHPIEIF
jgi:hypothetical protein